MQEKSGYRARHPPILVVASMWLLARYTVVRDTRAQRPAVPMSALCVLGPGRKPLFLHHPLDIFYSGPHHRVG